MDEVFYHRVCIADGYPLAPNAAGPQTAPWRCDECHTSWWVAELTREAHDAWRLNQGDFGHRGSETYKAIRAAVAIEVEAAMKRGVSLRREQLGLVAPRTIQALLKRGHVIEKGFEAEMRAHAK